MSTTRTRARLAVGGALALSLVVTGCGAGSSTTEPAAGGATSPTAAAEVSHEHNETDIRFAQMMIAHHRQAVTMAELAADRAESEEVAELAQQIRAAQDPEIETMSGFLEAWGAEVPTDDAMGGMEHGDMPDMGRSGTSGMMSPEQMQQLAGASGPAFDSMFLQMMIAHHEGAVVDAQRELADGVNPQAKELASTIVEDQTAEIEQMRQLLQSS
jgi:uncharacterized protein (DUF305 family)